MIDRKDSNAQQLDVHQVIDGEVGAQHVIDSSVKEAHGFIMEQLNIEFRELFTEKPHYRKQAEEQVLAKLRARRNPESKYVKKEVTTEILKNVRLALMKLDSVSNEATDRLVDRYVKSKRANT